MTGTGINLTTLKAAYIQIALALNRLQMINELRYIQNSILIHFKIELGFIIVIDLAEISFGYQTRIGRILYVDANNVIILI